MVGGSGCIVVTDIGRPATACMMRYAGKATNQSPRYQPAQRRTTASSTIPGKAASTTSVAAHRGSPEIDRGTEANWR